MPYIPGGAEESDDEDLYVCYAHDAKKSTSDSQHDKTNGWASNGPTSHSNDQPTDNNNVSIKKDSEEAPVEYSWNWGDSPSKNQKESEDAKAPSIDFLTEDETRKPFDVSYSESMRNLNELEMYLFALGLSHLIPIFDNHNLSLFDIIQFDEEDLLRIGVKNIAQRKTIIDSIINVHRSKYPKNTKPEVTKTLFSCSDAIQIVKNALHHLKYMECTLSYLEHRIHMNPDSLKYGHSGAGESIPTLHGQLLLAYQASDVLKTRLKNFASRIENIVDDVEFDIPDLIPKDKRVYTIDTVKPRRRITSKWILVTLAIAGVSIASAYYLKDFGVIRGNILVDLAHKYSAS